MPINEKYLFLGKSANDVHKTIIDQNSMLFM